MSLETLRKKKEQLRLTYKIEDSLIEASPYCSNCLKQSRRCFVDSSRSSKCAEYIRLKLRYDVSGDPQDRNVPRENKLDSLDHQIERLDEQKEEAMAKILRLEKQRSLLKARKKEIVRRGLKFLKELDKVEEKEQREREEAKL